MQVNDCIVQALGGGDVNEALLSFYHNNGATSAKLDDAEYEFLLAWGATPGQVNDMWLEMFTEIGYSGSLDDMFY